MLHCSEHCYQLRITQQPERLEVALAASLFLEGKLSLFQARKQPVHFCNPRQSKDLSVTVPEKY